MTPDQHRTQVAQWRAARDERLRSPDGWVALTGLHWLSEGENEVGAHSATDVVLKGRDLPARIGSLWVADGTVRLVPQRGAKVLHDGKRVGEMLLEDDRDGHPTVLELGTHRLHVIRRGDRFALRVRDAAAPALSQFRGMEHFPIDPAWRLVAQLEPAPPAATLEIVDVTGEISRIPTPGMVAFERDGLPWRIDAVPGGEDGSLWLIFGDATNGTETYGGGRFLYTEPPRIDGRVIVDFNLAYNPPCVFSPYATCPLPPPHNRLRLRITAGERMYPGGGDP
jgi:uncharacterized protein (DUF1684 family)